MIGTGFLSNTTRHRRLGFWLTVKNLGFVLKEAPFARRKAEAYLSKIIQTGQEIGAGEFMQRQAALNLERLRLPGKRDKG